MDKGADLKLEVSSTGTKSIKTNIRFSTQDEGTAKLAFFLFKDGVELPLNAVVGKIVMRMSDGSKFMDNVEIIDKVSGIAEYKLTTEQLKHYGNVVAELYLNYDNNQKMTVHRFSFIIEQALIDADIAVSTEFFVDDFYTLRTTVETIVNELGESIEETKQIAQETMDVINNNQAVKLADFNTFKESNDTKLMELMSKRVELFNTSTKGGVGKTYTLTERLDNYDLIYLRVENDAGFATDRTIIPSAMPSNAVVFVFHNIADGAGSLGMSLYEYAITFDATHSSFTVTRATKINIASTGALSRIDNDTATGIRQIIGIKL